MQDRILLSHKGANKSVVRLYYRALKAGGFCPWLDEEDMPAGTNPDRGIRQGFKDSCAVVFFLGRGFFEVGQCGFHREATALLGAGRLPRCPAIGALEDAGT